MASFASQLADALEYGWETVARPNQLPPPAIGRSGYCWPDAVLEKPAF